MSNQLTLTGYSTALFSTWYFIDEMGILFDCGDGVCAGLLQKSRKVKHLFVSHADRDHLAGLLQFNQLNARPELSIYYPRDAGSFPALANFSAKFDPQVSGTRWVPLDPGDEVQIRSDVLVRAVANRHVPTVGVQSKSLSYFVELLSKRLRSEHVGKTGVEIAAMRKTLGDDSVVENARTTRLVYSGDTPIETDGRYDRAEVLIHEATFLTSDELDPTNPRRNKHSSLEQVMQIVSESEIGTLVLGHFSSRYDDQQIIDAINHFREKYEIAIPIRVVLPGRVQRDILGGT